MVIASDSEPARVDRVTSGLPVTLRWREVRQHVPVELAERARTAAARGCRRRHRHHRRRLHDGPRQGHRDDERPADRRGADDVRRLRGHPRVGPDRGAHQAHGGGSRVLPVAVVYDSELSTSLPVDLSVASGLNALAHCVDSLWAPRADPINQALGLEGARASPRACRWSWTTRPERRAGTRHSTGATWRRSRSPRPAPGCTTRSVTCSGAPTTCPTRRRTRSSCRMSSPTTRRAVPLLAARLAAALGPPCRRRSGGRHCRRRRAHRVVPPPRGTSRPPRPRPGRGRPRRCRRPVPARHPGVEPGSGHDRVPGRACSMQPGRGLPATVRSDR